MTLDVGNSSSTPPSDTATVALTRNGTTLNYHSVTVAGGGSDFSKYQPIPSTVNFVGGDIVNFRTLAGGSSTNRGVVTVWFERTS